MRQDLRAAEARARGGYRFRKCPDGPSIEGGLSPDEKVLQFLRCQIGTKAATLVLTDKRVYSFAKGNVFGGLAAEGEVIPIPQITGVERARAPMFEWTITITRAANIDEYIYCDERESSTFVGTLRDLIHQASNPAPVVVQAAEPDALDQLKKLKELHQAGVVSDDEYEAKRRQLLDRI